MPLDWWVGSALNLAMAGWLFWLIGWVTARPAAHPEPLRPGRVWYWCALYAVLMNLLIVACRVWTR